MKPTTLTETVKIGQTYQDVDIDYLITIESERNRHGEIDHREITTIEVVASPFSEARSLAIFDEGDFWDYFQQSAPCGVDFPT